MWCLVWIWCVLGSAAGQRAIALLNSPVRKLPEAVVRADDQIQLNFQVLRGMIYLPGELNHESAFFIFDTGAPTLVLHEVESQPAEGDFSAYSCAGEVKVGARTVSAFSWADQTHRQLEALTLDMSHLGSPAQQPRGLIGYELFKHQVLCLDYEAGHLTLLGSRQWKRLRKLSEPLATFPIQLYGHLPVIKLERAGCTVYLGIDTGAAANLISPEALTAFEAQVSSRPQEELQGLDQEVQLVKAVSLSAFWSGQSAAHRFLVTDLSRLTAGSNWQLDGLLGYEFLARYRVVIDYPNQELSIWPL
jgi:hypothetical protein